MYIYRICVQIKCVRCNVCMCGTIRYEDSKKDHTLFTAKNTKFWFKGKFINETRVLI